MPVIEKRRQQRCSRSVAHRELIANRPFDMRRLLVDFCMKLGRELDGKGFLAITISPAMHRFFHGDPLVIQDLLNNIVHSGLKHLHHGVLEIQVGCEKVTSRQHKIFFVITVCGQEIPGTKPRRSLHSTPQWTAADPDAGSGKLTIAKMITTTLGGDMVVANTCGHGARYTASINLDLFVDPLTN